MSCVMLVSISPAVAAEDAPVKPTVEEILNDFHQKAFAAESANERGATTTYSRSASSDNDSLVQETVDTLNAAGYEAYNVTASNYEALETELKTDFASMGLDPNGSYIVVISGEDDSNSGTPNSRAGRLPEQIIIDDGSGAPTHFYYTYEEETYAMRYVTVTPADKATLTRQFGFGFDRAENDSQWASVFDAVFSAVIEEAADQAIAELTDFPVVSIISLVTDIAAAFPNSRPTVQGYDGFTVSGATSWTLQYIEVYDSANSKWFASQLSEYAISTVQPIHWVYDIDLEDHIPITGSTITFRNDSPFYNDVEYRKSVAAEYYQVRLRVSDYTEDIVFSITNPFTGSKFLINGDYEFTQEHWTWFDYSI